MMTEWTRTGLEKALAQPRVGGCVGSFLSKHQSQQKRDKAVWMLREGVESPGLWASQQDWGLCH